MFLWCYHIRIIFWILWPWMTLIKLDKNCSWFSHSPAAGVEINIIFDYYYYFSNNPYFKRSPGKTTGAASRQRSECWKEEKSFVWATQTAQRWPSFRWKITRKSNSASRLVRSYFIKFSSILLWCREIPLYYFIRRYFNNLFILLLNYTWL